MSMSDSLKRLALQVAYGHKARETRYIRWLRAQGVNVGEHVHIYSPWTVRIDTQRPWMIEIGNNVHITADCSILQHDYSWAVLQHMTGEILGSCGKVNIGNNVFIGQKSLILKGADIGDNVVIGAGSVVSKRLAGNAVYAGAPARKLMSIDDFAEKRKSLQLQEAVMLVHEYEQVYGKKPLPEILREFFFLFEPRDVVALNPVFKNVLNLDSQWDYSYEEFVKSQPKFSSYKEFLAYCDFKGWEIP